jgi:hypothetical protein
MTEAEVRAAYREVAARLAKLEAELAALLAHRGHGGGGGDGATPEQLRERERERRARLEAQRKKRRVRAAAGPRRRGRRTRRVRPVDRTLDACIDRAALPADARRVGYASRVVQDLAFRRDNVRVRRERWRSPSAGWTVAPAPTGYEHEFGPGVRAFVARLYWGCNVSFEVIQTLLRERGLQIALGTVAAMAHAVAEGLRDEARAAHRAGLETSPYAAIDGTYTRCDGAGLHVHVVTTAHTTTFVTTAGKTRLEAIGALGGGAPVHLVTAQVRADLALPPHHDAALAKVPHDTPLAAADFERALVAHLGWSGAARLRTIREATARAGLRAAMTVPGTLLADAATNYLGIGDRTAACWLHEIRHYEELTPYSDACRAEVETWIAWLRAFYDELARYRAGPTTVHRDDLRARFATQMAVVPAYGPLRACVARTTGRAARLLVVLDHPRVPTNNNDCERGARQRVRKREVSFGPRSSRGRDAWDTMQSVRETARQNGVNFHALLEDRVTRAGRVPRLAMTIRERAARHASTPSAATH